MNALTENALHLHRLLLLRGLKMATAESCTGGMVAMEMTEHFGSSGYFERGFVTYSNESKREMLGVCAETLESFGAVSEATALQMALGAITCSHADCSLAITGIAGPDGGSEAKPVGTVCFAWALRGSKSPLSETRLFKGDRHSIRIAAATYAILRLRLLLEAT